MATFDKANVTRASLIRAWNLSAETNTDLLKLLKSVRVDLSTTQVIKTRRSLLELSAVIGLALKEKQAFKPIDAHVRKAVDALDGISRKLEVLLTNERIDRGRMQVVIKRLAEIRSLVTGKSAPKKNAVIVDDDE